MFNNNYIGILGYVYLINFHLKKCIHFNFSYKFNNFIDIINVNIILFLIF